MNAIVVFPDAGPAMLPAIRDAFKQGSAVVPYRAKVGGKEGVDYTAFVGTDFKNDGVVWGKWMVERSARQGQYRLSRRTARHEREHREVGGPQGRVQGPSGHQVDRTGSLRSDELGSEPDGEGDLAALIAKYPKIDGMFADLSVSDPDLGRVPARRPELPLHRRRRRQRLRLHLAEDARRRTQTIDVQFTTSSAEQWNIRLAIQWAVASAAGGKVDEPLVITDTKGGKHTVANPGDKIVKNFVMDDSLKGRILRPESCRSWPATGPA